MVSKPHRFLASDAVIHIEQDDPPRSRSVSNGESPKDILPTMYDLPSEDPEEPGLPDVRVSASRDVFHDLQPQLLSRTLSLKGYSRENCFTASDLNLYYTVRHPLWHKRPDWFLVVDVPRLYEQRDLRRSYVLWQEDNPPTVVVKFLPPGTETEDLGRFYDKTARDSEGESTNPAASIVSNGDNDAKAKPPGKFELYETRLRVPYYFVYSRFTQRLQYFKLEGGQYQEQLLNLETPLVWLPDLEIGLGIWQGEFEGVTTAWLCWCDQAGNWLLTDTEQAQQQLDKERQAKEQAQTQLLQAAYNLLAAGMNLEEVAQMLNLSAAQVAAIAS